MTNIIMLFTCLIAGIALRLTKRVPEGAHVGINGYIIYIALPALILLHLHGISVSSDILWTALMPWILFGLSVATFYLLSRVFIFPPATTGALVISAGLANTSFVGIPMIETFFGPQGIPTGIVIDQLGTYLVLSTLGIMIACFYSKGTTTASALAYRIATFPPLVALIVAILSSPIEYSPWMLGLLQRLGDTLAPLALVSVGLQLRLEQVVGNRLPLALGLIFKLIVGPLAIAIIYLGVLRRTGETTMITIFEGAMGPQIGGAIVAIQYGLNPNLVTLMVGLGIALSFVTLPIWWWLLSML